MHQARNKFILPRKMKKTIANVEYLIRLGVPLVKAMDICGYPSDAEEDIRSKVRGAITFSSINHPEEQSSDEEVSIDVSVDNTGMIRRSYNGN